jgi:hypothetical protein
MGNDKWFIFYVKIPETMHKKHSFESDHSEARSTCLIYFSFSVLLLSDSATLSYFLRIIEDYYINCTHLLTLVVFCIHRVLRSDKGKGALAIQMCWPDIRVHTLQKQNVVPSIIDPFKLTRLGQIFFGK